MDKTFLEAHDSHTRAAWAFMATSRWFATSLDFLSFLLLTTSTLVATTFHLKAWFQIHPATLGLALTLLIQMANTNFPWMVRQSAEVVSQLDCLLPAITCDIPNTVTFEDKPNGISGKNTRVQHYGE